MLAISTLFLLSGCELTDEYMHDFGENDFGTILCIGDSITYGYGVGAAQSYPAQLAAMTGRRIINAGQRGEKSWEGRARIEGLLDQHKPGYVLILYGANDVIHSSSKSTPEHLRQMIHSAKARNAIPVVATLNPTVRGRGFMQPEIDNLNPRIRRMVREERIRLADIEKAFAERPVQLLQDDGLHPNAEGLRVIAAVFAELVD